MDSVKLRPAGFFLLGDRLTNRTFKGTMLLKSGTKGEN
jgi:hypothetical protein